MAEGILDSSDLCGGGNPRYGGTRGPLSVPAESSTKPTQDGINAVGLFGIFMNSDRIYLQLEQTEGKLQFL